MPSCRRLFRAPSRLEAWQAAELSSGVLEFTNLTPRDYYIVKLTAVDTEFNMTSREEYMSIVVTNQIFTYSSRAGSISISVDVSDDSRRVVAIAYLYWKEEPYNELDRWGIPLTNGVGSVLSTGLNIDLTYIVYLLFLDSAWNMANDFREWIPNGAGSSLNLYDLNRWNEPRYVCGGV